MKRRAVLFMILAAAAAQAGEQRASNVILFLADGGGIPTLNAASNYGYGRPLQLFIQNMPHIGLSETSSASAWVTDSAAAMTAIVTGRKTHNGVISQSDSAVRGEKDGAPLKTILEYAEERGLSTGVVSNSSVASATPAACYAQVNERKKVGEIFAQVLRPRFGNGVDVIIGPDRKEIIEATRKLGLDLEAELPKKGYGLFDSIEAVPAEAARVVALLPDEEFDLGAAVERAIDILSRNPQGFFLMVESNVHFESVLKTLGRTVAFDRVIRQAAERMKDRDTLILFTADHSYDLRVHDGRKGEFLIAESEKEKALLEGVDSVRLKNVRLEDDHTAEEVLVAAQGPGAERVRGIMPNTELFHIMMAAYGWVQPQPKTADQTRHQEGSYETGSDSPSIAGRSGHSPSLR